MMTERDGASVGVSASAANERGRGRRRQQGHRQRRVLHQLLTPKASERPPLSHARGTEATLCQTEIDHALLTKRLTERAPALAPPRYDADAWVAGDARLAAFRRSGERAADEKRGALGVEWAA